MSYKTIVLFTILMTNSLLGQWELINEGDPAWWSSPIDFVDHNVGWMSDQAVLMHTEDFGRSWNEIVIGDPEWGVIQYFDFIDDTLGWVFFRDYNLNKSILYNTTDNGESWQAKSEFADTVYFSAMEFLNKDIVFAARFTGSIIKSIDGGETWIDVSPPPEYEAYYSIIFFNSSDGIVFGRKINTINEVILRTEDGGATWEEQQIDISNVTGFQFVNDTTAYFLAHKDAQKLFCVTYDSLKSWEVKSEHALEGITSYKFVSADTVFAIAEKYIVQSTDTGRNWSQTYPLNEGFYNGIYFNSDKDALVTGSIPMAGWMTGRMEIRSKDRGINWAISLLTYQFETVYFYDGVRGFAAGGTELSHGNLGDIYVTNDGGATWHNNLSSGEIFQSTIFIDETGYSLSTSRRGSVIYRTLDSGSNWTIVHEPEPDPNELRLIGSDMLFIDKTTGWAAGAFHTPNFNNYDSAFYAGILFTEDGGENWNEEWKSTEPGGPTISINSLHFRDNTGWAVGGNGRILKYTDIDSWLEQSSGTTLPLNDVFFADENNGWVSGGFIELTSKMILLKTGDGGNSWNELPEISYLFNDMHFKDHITGWAAATDTSGMGFILKTEDGGNSWITEVKDLDAPVTALHFNEDYGWAVGGNGLVLKTDLVSWIDPRDGTSYPASFSLSQNYPNPFNPTTKIKYQITNNKFQINSKSQNSNLKNPLLGGDERGGLIDVKLKIYDLLGREAAVLVDKKQRPGEYEVVFDAGNLSSGVYFYKLEAGQFTETKKLILLK